MIRDGSPPTRELMREDPLRKNELRIENREIDPTAEHDLQPEIYFSILNSHFTPPSPVALRNLSPARSSQSLSDAESFRKLISYLLRSDAPAGAPGHRCFCVMR